MVLQYDIDHEYKKCKITIKNEDEDKSIDIVLDKDATLKLAKAFQCVFWWTK